MRYLILKVVNGETCTVEDPPNPSMDGAWNRLSKALYDLGDLGWELVCSITNVDHSQQRLIFKKP